MAKDKMGMGDSLEVDVSVPDDEMVMVEERVLAERDIERRGAVLPHTVNNDDPRGYAAYVAWQPAPICVRDITFAPTADEIESNLDAYLASVTQAQCNEALGPWS